MRFQRLDLIAFGHFTNVSIDLSAGNYGLHMIFGSNEAGKSSSLRALTDFLYGIPSRSSDSFLHPYGKMRIGGIVSGTDGRQLHCIRRKATQGPLREKDDVGVIPDKELTSFLGDVDRELFCTLFGINHTTLRRGGEELVQGSGQLGTSLFASASGLAGLRDLQLNIANSIERVFKPSGRSGSLVDSINQYKEKKDQQKENQVTADAYNKHVHDRQVATDERARLDQVILDLELKKRRLERIGNSIQPIADWRHATEKLEAIGNVAMLPADFAIASSKLVNNLQKVEHERDSKKADIESMDAQLQQLSEANPILKLADRIEKLTVRSGEYSKGKFDSARNETFRQQSEHEARDILRAMGREVDLSKVEDLRIPASKVSHIQSLGTKYEGLAARVESSSDDLRKLQKEIDTLEKKFSKIKSLPNAHSLRDKLLQVQRQGDLESQSDKLRTDIQNLESEIDGDLKRLNLWKGSAEALAALATPTAETIDRFDNEWTQCDSEIKAIRKRKSDAEKELRSLENELERLESMDVIPTESELSDHRKTRDLGWQLVRKAWIEGSQDPSSIAEFVAQFSGTNHLSEAFEQSIVDADRISDQLRSDADRVASKARILLEIKQQAQEIAKIQEEETIAFETKKSTEQNWELQWEPLGIQPLPPREMRSWTIARAGIVEQVVKLAAWKRNLESNESKIARCVNDLREELETLGVALPTSRRPLHDILEIALRTDKEIQLQEKDRHLCEESIAKAKSDANTAESALDKANAAMSQWKSDWEIEMRRLGLEPDASPDRANAMLNMITELFQKLHEADGFRKRNLGIERDGKQFLEDLERIANEIGVESTSLSVDQLISRFNADLDTARQNATLRTQLIQQKESAAKQLDTAEKTYHTLLKQVEEMCRQAGCSKPDELPEVAELSNQRRVLLEKQELFAQQIRKFAGGRSFEEFLEEVDAEAVNPDSIEPRIDQLSREIRQAQDSRDVAVTQIERATNQLQSLDKNENVGDLATECESIAASIEDELRELAVLKVCAVVLASGIERFREKNQDPMIVSASEHFRAMTCEAFSGVRADLDENGKAILVGIRAQSGESVHVSQMSDGTCDQLYLALRLASLEARLEKHEPIPFVVDDILLNFDDRRALATLQRLAILSAKTQVIFFTHHRHLVDLAKANISSNKLFVHDL